jgi:hypothetical protein
MNYQEYLDKKAADKTIKLKELISMYSFEKGNAAELAMSVTPFGDELARDIADYILRCSDFDSSIIDLIVARSSGPI